MATTIEKTLEKFATGGQTNAYKVGLRTLYMATKPVKGFFKGAGRLVDKKHNMVWFEVTGNSPTELASRARGFAMGKANVFTGVVVKTTTWYSGGRLLDLNPGKGIRATPVPSSHPDLTNFPAAVAPKGSIGDLLKCQAHQRVDVVGFVVDVVIPNIKADKAEVWLKGDDDRTILVEMWGATFKKLCGQLQAYATVLQVDNARVVVKENGVVHLNAEFFSDTDKGGSWAFVDPAHERTAALLQLSHDSGHKISTAWTPSARSGMVRLAASSGDKLATCLSTLLTNSLAWDDDSAAATHSVDALPEMVEVAVFGVCMTQVNVASPVYTECRTCHTKIDDITSECKGAQSDKGCTTLPGDRVAFAPIRLNDFSGAYDDIMVQAKQLWQLAGLANVGELDELIEKSALPGLCHRGRFDVVIVANQKAKGKKKGAPKPGEVPACRFQVLRVVPRLLGEWNTKERPAVSNILRVEGASHGGQILPIRSPAHDVEETPAGIKFAHGPVFPQLVLTLGRTTTAPTMQDSGCGDLVEVTYSDVLPVATEQEGETAFAVEWMCERSRAEALAFDKGSPHLILGAVSLYDAKATILAEGIWPVGGDSGVQHFKAELAGVWKLLATNVHEHPAKRSAKHLITHTPSKRPCTEGPLLETPPGAN